MKYKISKIEIIWAVLSFPLFLFILTTVLSGAGNISYQGFAYDREGNLYLGRKYRIDVFAPNGEMAHSIPVESNMSYDFTLKDETVIVHAGSFLYWIDLSGNGGHGWTVQYPDGSHWHAYPEGGKREHFSSYAGIGSDWEFSLDQQLIPDAGIVGIGGVSALYFLSLMLFALA